jgi:ribonucleoside-diphosphate reductase alpha chain
MLLDTNFKGIKVTQDFIRSLIHQYSFDLDQIDVDKIMDHLLLELELTSSIANILSTLTRICNNLISELTPDYQYLAGRLHMVTIYRKVYGEATIIPSLKTILDEGVASGIYAPLTTYSDAELNYLNQELKHDRDNKITYAGWLSFETRYLLKSQVRDELYETPQILYMLIAMYGFQHYTGQQRLELVVRFYNAISLHKVNLPTPILVNMRTRCSQFSSCVLMEVGDSISSQARTIEAVMQYSANSAGMGINIGGIRGVGSPVRSGRQVHQGYIPYIKLLESTIKGVSQGGVRSGSLTIFYPIWNLEVESLLVLKNNRGNEDNRVRHVDYGVQLSRLFYERFIQKQSISLFSTSEVPGLYEAFFRDQREFERIYKAAEQNPQIRKKTIPAVELFTLLSIERSQTGRIYIQNVDHCNDYSSFNEHAPSIKGSNLCMEILLPTTEVRAQDDDYEIALCTLAAINLGVTSTEEFPGICDILVRFLDEVVEHQYYPLTPAATSTHKRRSLGIGVTNLAYFLAKNHLKYEDPAAANLVHHTFEAIQYYLIEASSLLAEERGPCTGFSETTYSQGIMPIDNYKPEIDKHHSASLLLDWEALRARVLKYGMRNATLTAIMPCESSSIISNSTNGIEPPRSAVSSKQGKQSYFKFVVPEYIKLKKHYTFLWEMPSNEGYLRLCGIMQKFIDQSLSTNTSYNPNNYPKRLLPLDQIIADVLLAYKLGIKTLYYQNTLDDIMEPTDCGCTI